MGLESDRLSQRSDQPAESSQLSESNQSSDFGEPSELGQSSTSAASSTTHPSDSSLSPIMNSLTPNASATPVDSAPQYPSLEAAVGVEQQIAPTLTNLLAAELQITHADGLSSAALAVESMGARVEASGAHAAESTAPTVEASLEESSSTDKSSADTSSMEPQQSFQQPFLPDEQGPLGGTDLVVTTPDASEEPVSDDDIQEDDVPVDASWAAIAQEAMPSADQQRSAMVVNDAPSDRSDLESQGMELGAAQVVDHQAVEHADAGTGENAEMAEPTESELGDTDSGGSLEVRDGSASDGSASDGSGNDGLADHASDHDRSDAADDFETDQESEADDDFESGAKDGAVGDRAQQVLIKREENHVAVIFPQESSNANPDVDVEFIDSQLWQDLQQRLSGGTTFASDTPVHLYGQNCLLDTRQLQGLDEALGRFNLKLARIITSRRQTAVAAAMSGYSADQTNNLPELLSKEVYSPQKIGLAEPLYLQKNIRSGTEIRHPGSVVVIGDLNPGSSVVADGDILVWGRLRGIAHAGASGNKTSTIMALKLEATQLRIAGAVARVAVSDQVNPSPEIAYISEKDIRITSAYSFNRNVLAG